MKRAITLSIISIGFTAITSQIIFIREFLTVFCGNELSISFIFANWLIAGAVGSAVLGRIADRVRQKFTVFALCQACLAVTLPLSMIAIRSIRSFLNINPGETISVFAIFVSSFIILAPICITLGYMFSHACRIYESEGRSGAANIGRVYSLEALGSIIGGLIVSFLLIRLLDSTYIIAIISLLNIGLSLLLLAFFEETRLRPVTLLGISIMFILAISMMLFNGEDEKWRGYDLLASKNSIYGNIAVTRRADQISFFDNGLHLYTVPDKLASEEASHYTLLSHPDPKAVLLVGGGVGGLVEEIIKHPVENVDYVELDPLIIEMAKRYLPDEHRRPLEDARVSVLNLDARLYIKRSSAKYDCVIINIGDPYTAQLNRYYTVEFFKELRGVLNEGGIISFGLSSSESYISKENAEFLRSIYSTLKEAFEDIKIIPGETAYFLASDAELPTYDYKILMARLAERHLEIKYVREYYLFSKLSSQRISYIENLIKDAHGAKANHDFQPIAYYQTMVFWSSRFRDSILGTVLKSAAERHIWIAALIILISILIFTSKSMRDKKVFRRLAMATLMTSGFTMMAIQIIIMLSFQMIYGYLFYKLGFILTAFMIGLALGSSIIVSVMPKIKRSAPAFIWAQAAILIYPLMLIIILHCLANSKEGAGLWLGSNVLFPSLPILAGFIGGVQFPLANKIYMHNGEELGATAGLGYGLDLLGSCIGAVLTGVILIPILGVPKTCALISIMNFTILVLLMLSKKFSPRSPGQRS